MGRAVYWWIGRDVAPNHPRSAAAEAAGRAAGVLPVRKESHGRDGEFFRRRAKIAGLELFMEIETSRFGLLSVDDERIMTFPRGLLGFPGESRFALIQAGQENYFFWLQSIEDPNLAFVVTDPSTFFKDYEVPMRDETLTDLKMADVNFAQVFVICNRVGEWLTGNLLGPIVVNAANRLAHQVVLTEKKWTTRQPLLKLQSEVALAKSA
ncbi:MAG: flagellar assembly protein FliW [Planctomycetota bacterium]|nr:flagellar assembly protein FliW [Planctomycetota bacterium]